MTPIRATGAGGTGSAALDSLSQFKGAPALTLYGFPASPNTWKVRAVADHIGARLKFQFVDLAKAEQRTPEYLAINPKRRTPALVEGDFKLWESTAIMHYIAIIGMEEHGAKGLRSGRVLQHPGCCVHDERKCAGPALPALARLAAFSGCLLQDGNDVLDLGMCVVGSGRAFAALHERHDERRAIQHLVALAAFEDVFHLATCCVALGLRPAPPRHVGAGVRLSNRKL
jgi:hypothetical protein